MVSPFLYETPRSFPSTPAGTLLLRLCPAPRGANDHFPEGLSAVSNFPGGRAGPGGPIRARVPSSIGSGWYSARRRVTSWRRSASRSGFPASTQCSYASRIPTLLMYHSPCRAASRWSAGQEIAPRPHPVDGLNQPLLRLAANPLAQPPAAPEDLHVDQQLLRAKDHRAAQQARAQPASRATKAAGSDQLAPARSRPGCWGCDAWSRRWRSRTAGHSNGPLR